MNETRLRDLYAQALALRGAESRARCASPDAIRALVRREGAEDDRLATLDHVMACDACSREFELLRAIDRAGATLGVPEAVGTAAEPAGRTGAAVAGTTHPRARSRWGPAGALALAASIILAVGVGVLNRPDTPDEGEVMRGDGAALALVAPPAEVPAGMPVTFVWRSVPGVSRYELELLDAGGEVVFATATGDTSATLGETGRLTPGAEYRWWVRASDGAAGAQRASPVRRLRVRSE